MKKFNLDVFNPNKSYVIEASAGTGKTYNIVEIVDKLVNVYDFDLHKILIVTYTDKAAGELKDRIRQKIKNADVDNAPIYTIHSFCQNTIKEFGISASLPLNLNVIDDSKLYDFVEIYIRKGDILKDITDILNYDKNNELNIDVLKDYLVNAIKKYYLNINNQEDDSIVNLLQSKEEVRKQLNLYLMLAKKTPFEEILINYPEIDYYYNILKNSDDEKAQLFAEDIKIKYLDNFSYNGVKYKQSKYWPKYSDDIEALEFFKKLKSKKCSYNKVLAHLYLQDFYLKWQEEKELNKNQTFDDMIRYVREAILRDNKLKIKLKEKYSRAIIDEFQDTNQKQFDIFSSLFLEDDDHKIIVVGDPKQSIYSFQGADINVYYKAVKLIEQKGGEICMLKKNYRSTGNMVRACNNLFNYYDFSGTNFVDSDFLDESIGDKEHKALYNNEELKAVWVATNGGVEIDEKKSRLFSKIAVQQIIDCCLKDENGKTKLQIKDSKSNDYRNVTFKDFAVLARTSSEMIYIEKALKNAGIPYIRYKDNKLFTGKECLHWICLLSAINIDNFTGRNLKVFKKAMFTSFFGYSIKDISSDYFDGEDSEEYLKLIKWKQLAFNNKWEDLFDDILINSYLPQNTNSRKEMQSLAIYKQIANYCISYLSNNKTIGDLIRQLQLLSNGNNSEDEQNGSLIEKSTNFDCVQIMTIHASKGLQFPVVIGVCGFNKPINDSIKTYHIYDEVLRKERLVLDFDGSDIAKNEEIAEWKRLYYVAYTRAQFLMILPFYKAYGKDFLKTTITKFINEHHDEIRFIEDNMLTYSELRNKSSEILSYLSKNENTINNKDEQDKVLKDIINQSFRKKTFKHSYSSLSHSEVDEIIYEDSDINKEGNLIEGLSIFDTKAKVVDIIYDANESQLAFPSDYPRGARIGTALHEIMEHTDFSRYQDNIMSVIENSFINNGVTIKDTWVSVTKEVVGNVCETKLPIINGSVVTNNFIKLQDITLDNRKDEVEFNFNLLNEKLRNYCNGFVDLIFKYGEYYSIIDWKSDSLNDDFESYSDKDSLKQHVDNSYSIQRVLYSYCLIKWLKSSMKDLTEEEIFNNHFGGVYYIFLRGCNRSTSNGVYAQTWNSWNDLLDAFNDIIKIKVGGNLYD